MRGNKSKPTTGPNSSDSENKLKGGFLKKTAYARIVSSKPSELDPAKSQKNSARNSARSGGSVGSVGALSRASCMSARKIDKFESINN